MRLFYAVRLKKEGRSTAAPSEESCTRWSGFRRVFSAGEAGSWAQFGANNLGVGDGCGLRGWRRRGQLLRQRLAFHEQLHLVGVNDFAFEESLRNAFEGFAIGG